MSIYGCHDEPRPIAGAPLLVQDGYIYGLFDHEAGHADRIARMIEVPYVMTVPCQYTQHNPSDKECDGCPWQSKADSGEAPSAPKGAGT